MSPPHCILQECLVRLSPVKYYGGEKRMIQTNIKNIISVSILSIVGALFVFKYSSRLISNTFAVLLIVAVYIIGYQALFIFLNRLDAKKHAWLSNQRLLLAAFGLLIIGAIVVVTIMPDTSRVTRYSAIVEWIRRWQAGQFPWGGQTQFAPSGLPFLFMLALPFYYLGNIGYMEVIGIILFGVILLKFYAQNRAKWLSLFLLVLLPTFYYEILVRSELFFNMVLIIFIIALTEKYLDPQKPNLWFFILGIFLGLGLSTRSIVGLIYAGYYVYKFRRHVWQGILFSGFSLFVFGLTLLPFMAENALVFLGEGGPFSVQMGYLSVGATVVFVLISMIAGWSASNMEDVFFYEGLLLFLIVVIALLPVAAQLGLYETIIKDGFDITYFIFCVPFLLLPVGGQQSVSALNAINQ